MCNDYEQHAEWDAYCRAMADAQLGMPADASPAQLHQADDIWVKDTARVMIAAGNTVDLVPMTWGFPPDKPGRPPVFNFRSDGRHFGQSKRCLIPASAFFEFTGEKTPKSKWRFTLEGAPVMAIAGLWRQDAEQRWFTMLTTPPGPDLLPFHDRQIAVLAPNEWGHWLYLDRPEGELLRPLPEGSLRVGLHREGRDKPAAALLRLAAELRPIVG
jgi:putative SOS response-associated peptidase YedK